MKNFLKWAGIVFIGLILISVVRSLVSGSKDKTTVTTTSTTDSTKAGAVSGSSSTTTTETIPSAWKYSEEEDKMTSKKNFYAQVDAKDELDFKFPYNGGSVATLGIIKRSTGATDMALSVTKGQIMAAHGLGNGKISIRFDDSAAQTMGVTGAADGSSNIVFFQGAPKLLAKLKTAKRVFIQAEFFDNGSAVMEFNTAGLEWNH